MAIVSANPATGRTLRTFEPLSASALEEKVQRAWTAFHEWKATPFSVRSGAMSRAASILEREKRQLGALITTEMGKTLASAIAEAEKCALGCRYYAENAERLLADEVIATDASQSYVMYQPLGPVLAVMPWNFPFWQVFRFAAPALMAGNVGLLKHASNVPQCGLAIEDVLRRAGFPEGVFQTLLIESGAVEPLLYDDRIVAATLTGSEPAGMSVAKHAGSQIKKTVLELGGSDPFIVMASGGGPQTTTMAVNARTINNGQSCIAAKRFIVAESIYDDFERGFVAGMQALKTGDPIAAETQLGPLATAQLVGDLHAQVERAVADGAHVLTGGRKIERPGNFYEPTVLKGVSRESTVYRQELFGPVAMIFRVKNVQEAIGLANDSPFGLGASVWTTDPEEQRQCIDCIEAGQVFVNAIVASDPRLPFGGVKRSGYGRELASQGIKEFVNIKTIWVK